MPCVQHVTRQSIYLIKSWNCKVRFTLLFLYTSTLPYTYTVTIHTIVVTKSSFYTSTKNSNFCQNLSLSNGSPIEVQLQYLWSRYTSVENCVKSKILLYLLNIVNTQKNISVYTKAKCHKVISRVEANASNERSNDDCRDSAETVRLWNAEKRMNA